MMRRPMLAAALLTALLAAGLTRPGSAADEGWIKLFNGKDLNGWKVFLDPKKEADPNKIFTVEDGVIRCEGSVNGYIRTEKEFGDFVLRVQWRWGEKGPKKGARNSGVFVFVSGEDKIWPKGVEAQLMADH